MSKLNVKKSLNPIKARLSGFTLIELLVVLAILSLIAAFVPTALVKLRDAVQYQDMVRHVMADFRLARQQAKSQGIHKRFVVNLAEKKYGVEGQSLRPIPDSIHVKATIGSGLLSSDGVASWVFLPDGGATGGTLEVIRASNTGTRIRVDWFAGEIQQESF